MTTPAPSCHCGEPHPFVRLIAICLALFFVSFYTPAAQAQAKADLKSVDVPAGDALTTLKELSSQVGGRLLYTTESVSGVQTRAVKGQMTAADALEIMLADTGLVAVSDPKTGAVAVRRESEAEAKNVSRAIAESSDRPKSSRIEEHAAGEKVLKLDTFEVFGRKTLNMDIRRTQDDVQPYVVFDADMITSSGAISLEEFFRTRLPMNVQRGSGQVLGGGSRAVVTGDNRSLIDLRGLGANQTLILVDGRRLPSASQDFGDGTLQQADINGIPMSAVQRVEILPSTAGGIYGGGATGGVINIILKRDYSGADLAATYGNTFDGVSRYQEYSIRSGFTLEDGKTRVLITGSWQKSDPMIQGDRPFLVEQRRRRLINSPPAQTVLNVGLRTLTPTIKSATNTLLVLDNGTPLNSIFTSIPRGYAGPSTDAGVALIARAGVDNFLTLADDAAAGGLRTPLTNASEVSAYRANIRRTFSDRVEAFLDLNWARNEGQVLVPPQLSPTNGNLVTLAADAPNNPFQQSIQVLMPLPGLESPVATSSGTNYGALLGVIIKLPRAAFLEFDHSESVSLWERSTPDSIVLGAAVDAALQNGTLNVMRDVNLFPIDYSPYLAITRSTFESRTRLRDTTIRFSSPEMQAVGGRLVIAGYGERRSEITDDAPQVSERFGTHSFLPERSQTIWSGYLESRVNFDDLRLGKSVSDAEVQASLRHDAYTTNAFSPTFSPSAPIGTEIPRNFTPYESDSKATKYTVGMSVQLFKTVTLRASYGTGFLAPAVEQIAPRITESPMPITAATPDPRRGNTPYNFDAFGNVRTGTLTLIGLGNTQLRPESSESFSAGAIVTVPALKGLRLYADYTTIKKTDEIGTLGQPMLLQFEELFPGRVTRGPNLPGDLPGWAGPVTGFDTSRVNFAKTEIEAVDFKADYNYQLGQHRLGFYGIGTRQIHQKRQIAPLAPFIENVDSRGGALKFRGNLGITWEHGRWRAGWNMQYYAGYSAVTAGASAATRNLTITLQGAERIPAQRYHDLFVQYSLPWQGPFAGGWSVQLNVNNVLNDEPPFDATEIYSRLGDPRLRRFSLTIRKAI